MNKKGSKFMTISRKSFYDFACFLLRLYEDFKKNQIILNEDSLDVVIEAYFRKED